MLSHWDDLAIGILERAASGATDTKAPNWTTATCRPQAQVLPSYPDFGPIKGMTSAQRRSYQSVANERHRRKHGSDKYAISTTCIRSGCDEPRLLGNVCGAHLFLEMYTEPRRPRSQAKQNSKKLRLDGIKVATGCVDGGYCSGQLTARMLHFHHTDPPTKSFELNAHGISGRPWDEIEAELAKCVVLCALCHTARHESGLL